MKFKLDENLPNELLEDLHKAGHGVDTVADEGLAGSPDGPLLEQVKREGRVFLTMDKGIANVRIYPPDQYAGLILFRPNTSGREAVVRFVRKHIPTLLERELMGRLFVVSDRGIRVR